MPSDTPAFRTKLTPMVAGPAFAANRVSIPSRSKILEDRGADPRPAGAAAAGDGPPTVT
jgi:hypothetical protein